MKFKSQLIHTMGSVRGLFSAARLPGLLCLSLLTLPTSFAADKQAQEEQLEHVKQRIKQTQTLIANQQKAGQQLEEALKLAEKQIADVARTLVETRQKRAQTEHRQEQLDDQNVELRTEKKKHQKALSKQLASAYMTGTHDYSKMLFNQQNPALFERTLSYYQYLNNARTDNLEALQKIQEQLEQVKTELESTHRELTSIIAEQTQQQANLNQYQAERKKTLVSLKRSIKSEQEQLVQLRDNEQALADAIARIQELALVPIKLEGLKPLKGKLSWPAGGKIRHRFGHRRHGRLKWKGVMINSESGTPIKTIHHGQVLFSDWMKGFGWVIVIDHGDGYMSLYGHNQTLLKSVGEKVEAGEPIALAGQSGGQDSSGLYFEIRHQGKAINPALWCKRQV